VLFPLDDCGDAVAEFLGRPEGRIGLAPAADAGEYLCASDEREALGRKVSWLLSIGNALIDRYQCVIDERVGEFPGLGCLLGPPGFF